MTHMTDPAAIERFLLAGNATLTLTSRATEKSFTYKVKPPKDEGTDEPHKRYFVGLLSGPDNETDYTYLGMVEKTLNGLTFRLTAGSKVTAEAAAYKAFKYFFDNVISRKRLPEALEVRHEGRCCRCGRALTTPESIDSGVGPECAAKMGVTWERNAPASVVAPFQPVRAVPPVAPPCHNHAGGGRGGRRGSERGPLPDESVNDLHADPSFDDAWRADLQRRLAELRREGRRI